MANRATRYILHADLDAFYASVEQRDAPTLKGRPVVVGGPPESRGVVAAASYEARAYGVRSAMPMRTAMRLCQELVRVPPRFNVYHEVSRQVMDIFLRVTPQVQPLSLDEAYMDLQDRVPIDIAEKTALDLKESVKNETELAVTIGGGTSKTVAKIASQLAKPDGLLLIKDGEEREFLKPLDVEMLWGVGPKTARLFRQHNINTIGELGSSKMAWLQQIFGKRGPELRDRALGIDHEQVVTERDVKSVSAETTMATDIDNKNQLLEEMDRLVYRVATHLQREGLRGKTVSIKLRLADFTTFTRQKTLSAPTGEIDVILQLCRQLLLLELKPGRKFRLIGAGVSNFRDNFQLALLPLD